MSWPAMELPLDQVLVGDCIELMRLLPAGSIDCVFADPPYNLQLRGELRRPDDSLVDGVDDDWDKFGDYAEYDRHRNVSSVRTPRAVAA